jgi:acyl-CoA thioesterase I
MTIGIREEGERGSHPERQRGNCSSSKVARLLYGALLGVVACSGGAGDASSGSLPAPDSAAVNSPQPRRSILVVGTSLTAGLGLEPEQAYPAVLQQKVDSAKLPYEVVNAGVSGETSSALLRRIDWVLQQPFDVILIETGANDGLRGVPVETMRANMRQIIASVRAARPAARVALIQMEAPPNMGGRYTRDFRDSFPLIARETGVALLPFLLEGVAGVRSLNQGDGIHPNEPGARIVAENVWKGLRLLLD